MTLNLTCLCVFTLAAPFVWLCNPKLAFWAHGGFWPFSNAPKRCDLMVPARRLTVCRDARADVRSRDGLGELSWLIIGVGSDGCSAVEASNWAEWTVWQQGP